MSLPVSGALMLYSTRASPRVLAVSSPTRASRSRAFCRQEGAGISKIPAIVSSQGRLSCEHIV